MNIENNNQPKPKGGKREGSGAPKKDPTIIINFRVPKDKATELKPLLAAYLQSLLNPTITPPKLPIGLKPGNGIKAGPPPAPKRFNLAEELAKLKEK